MLISTMLSCAILVFHLLVVGALIGPFRPRTKRRLEILTDLICGCCFVSCVLGYTAMKFAVLLCTFKSFSTVLKNRIQKKRRWKRRLLHRKIKRFKLRWAKLHPPLRSAQPFSHVDGDCAFVALSQGLKLCGFDVGCRKLRKMAWQDLKRSMHWIRFWDGFLPTKIQESGLWNDYLDGIRKPGSWGSDLELRALATRFNVSVEIWKACQVKRIVLPDAHYTIVLKLRHDHFSFCELKHSDSKCNLPTRILESAQHVWETCFCTNDTMWRAGSARATKKKRNQRDAVQGLRNLKLPEQWKFLSPIIPMLVDLLSQYQPAKKNNARNKYLRKQRKRQEPDVQSRQPTKTETKKGENKTICWYHANGCCKFGKNCFFSHEQPKENPKTGVAKEDNAPPVWAAPDLGNQQPTNSLPQHSTLELTLRPEDWNAPIYNIAAFCDMLDKADKSQDLRAIVQTNDDSQVDLVRQLLDGIDHDSPQVMTLQPCRNVQQAHADQKEIVNAPVRANGNLKPRTLIMTRLTTNCNVSMVPARVKKPATTPSIAPTVVMRIACEARFVDKETWNRAHKKPAVYARQWAEQVVGLQHRKCVCP